MAAQIKTPGVYIKELNAFPNSVVEVATAVPAFIGYTEKALRGTTSLLNVPTRITSLKEYVDNFGGAPKTQFGFSTDKPEVLAADPATSFLLYYSLRLFFDNGGGPCYIVSVGSYDSAAAGKQANDFTAALPELVKEQEPTLVVAPDAVLLAIDGWQTVCQQVLLHCVKMQSRIALFDVFDGNKARTHDDKDVITGQDGFRNKVPNDNLNYAVAYYPWVNTSIVDAADVNYSFLKEADREKLITDQQAVIKQLFPEDPPGTANPKAAELSALWDKIKTVATDAAELKRNHQALFAISESYRNLMGEIRRQLNVLPPAAALAGVYTRVDNTVGVFKAPANTGINSVISPTVNITHDEQEDLNVPLDGKAINAIRTFPGRGVLIWGARTLDGNSQDWRYINVRRTLIMLEQSIKQAAQAYVFAPNNAGTWVTVANTISNYLTNKWKEGALVGATPPEAFSVDVGLGSTMTANDILDGFMLVTVKVAIVRPAEFIVITFQQKMQTS
ncbi:MAG: phage tail sheath C-terminal domain-containing protein [Methylococcaceae bacterium]|nr:phage tail sheath C-terminal domain-containing protein [Methylococcaceae bacterium]